MKYKVIRQSDEMLCGVTCLAMICEYYGIHNISLSIIRNFVFSVVTVIICFTVFSFLPAITTAGYIRWIINAAYITAITLFFTVVIALLVYRKDFIELIRYFKSFLLRIMRKRK